LRILPLKFYYQYYSHEVRTLFFEPLYSAVVTTAHVPSI